MALTLAETPILGVSFSDADSGENDVIVLLSVRDGSLTLPTPPTDVVVTANGSSTVNIIGSVAEVNALLNTGGISYRSFPNFSGTDRLTISMDDNGFSGPGSNQLTTVELAIRVFAHPLDQWQHDKFGAARDDPSLEKTVWGNNADADLDGILNLIEYILGLEPLDGQSIVTWENIQVDATLGMVMVNVDEIRDPRVNVEVEVASQLNPAIFSVDPSEIRHVSTTDLGIDFNLLVFKDQKAFNPEERRYYRLKVTYTP